jgi:hypothetical protein
LFLAFNSFLLRILFEQQEFRNFQPDYGEKSEGEDQSELAGSEC